MRAQRKHWTAAFLGLALLAACSRSEVGLKDDPLPADTVEEAIPTPIDAESLSTERSTPDGDQSTQAWGGISGTVTDEAGRPIVGSCVVVDIVRTSPPEAPGDAPGGGWFACAMTDNNGRYRKYPLSTGDYTVSFAASHLVDLAGSENHFRMGASRYVPEWHDNAPSQEEADEIHVVLGRDTTVDAQVVTGGSIAGQITSQTRGPLGGACASVYTADTHQLVASAWTDAEGKYVVQGLPAGRYKIGFTDICSWVDTIWQPRPQYRSEYFPDARDWDAADTITVSLGKRISGINAVLADPDWSDLAITKVSVGPPAESDLTRTITVEITNVGEAPWHYSTGAHDALPKAWIVDPNGHRTSLESGNPHQFEVPSLDPGEHFEATFEWRGPLNAGGWTILTAVCMPYPGWDPALANNTRRTDAASANDLGDPPAHRDLCGAPRA